MRNMPLPIRDLELRDLLSELLGEALSERERAAPLHALRSVLRLVEVQGHAEIRFDALLSAVERTLHEGGLRMSAKEAIEKLFESKLLQAQQTGIGHGLVRPSEELHRELPAALSRVEAYCRGLELPPRPKNRSMGQVERAIQQAAWLFNEGLFFEVHEVLEAVWLKQGEQTRPFLQGLIQIAVGFHHLQNRNLPGALSLLREGLVKVKDYRPASFGLELDQFLEQVEASYHSIDALRDEAFDRFDRQMIPRMRLLE
jgi:hypothetical protein